jgi:hypothetical protein
MSPQIHPIPERFADLRKTGSVEKPDWSRELFEIVELEGTFFTGQLILTACNNSGRCQFYSDQMYRVNKRKGRGSMRIWLGWALDWVPPGKSKWVPHAACSLDGVLIEPSDPFSENYFGLVLDLEQSERFAQSDYPGKDDPVF